MKIAPLVIFLILSGIVARAQMASSRKNASSPKSSLVLEKVYLHTDHDVYAAGDTIWYKAYLADARTNRLSNSSRNLQTSVLLFIGSRRSLLMQAGRQS